MAMLWRPRHIGCRPAPSRISGVVRASSASGALRQTAACRRRCWLAFAIEREMTLDLHG